MSKSIKTEWRSFGFIRSDLIVVRVIFKLVEDQEYLPMFADIFTILLLYEVSYLISEVIDRNCF